MKTLERFLSAFVLCSVVAMPMSAQFKKNAVSFDTYEWDFGTVASDKGAVCHTFTLKNNTKKDVRIGKQIPSCNASRPVMPMRLSVLVNQPR